MLVSAVFFSQSDPRVLIEVRRHLGRAFAVNAVAPVDFDRRLSERYAMEGAAAAVAGELGDSELDLLAGDVPDSPRVVDVGLRLIERGSVKARA